MRRQRKFTTSSYCDLRFD